jgi:tRNA-specific 2-thiouridylase
MFPLASMSKEETRAIASEMGLINAEKKESMEICFVSNGHHSDFVQSHISPEVDVSAKLILEDGTQVGEVDRYFRFTVGQRRGLPVSGYYIKDINSESRIITLSNKRVKTGEISLTRTNWYEDTSSISRRIFAKTNHRGQLYEISISGDTISFYEEVNLPARGQVVVIYDEEGMVIGGGYIK